MVIENACEELGSVPFEAVIVPLNVPAAVGVPEIAPVALAKASPVGSAPVVTVNVIGAVPVAVTV